MAERCGTRDFCVASYSVLVAPAHRGGGSGEPPFQRLAGAISRKGTGARAVYREAVEQHFVRGRLAANGGFGWGCRSGQDRCFLLRAGFFLGSDRPYSNLRWTP